MCAPLTARAAAGNGWCTGMCSAMPWCQWSPFWAWSWRRLWRAALWWSRCSGFRASAGCWSVPFPPGIFRWWRFWFCILLLWLFLFIFWWISCIKWWIPGFRKPGDRRSRYEEEKRKKMEQIPVCRYCDDGYCRVAGRGGVFLDPLQHYGNVRRGKIFGAFPAASLRHG